MNQTTNHTHGIKIFSCRGSRYLAEKIAKSLGLDLGDSIVTDFSDGEFQPAFNESVLDNLFELLLMIDAARRASAYKVIAVIPYFGWARQSDGPARTARTVPEYPSEPSWWPTSW